MLFEKISTWEKWIVLLELIFAMQKIFLESLGFGFKTNQIIVAFLHSMIDLRILVVFEVELLFEALDLLVKLLQFVLEHLLLLL